MEGSLVPRVISSFCKREEMSLGTRLLSMLLKEPGHEATFKERGC